MSSALLTTVERTMKCINTAVATFMNRLTGSSELYKEVDAPMLCCVVEVRVEESTNKSM